jgi:Trk K+ transport system NAD-binding subunit
MAKTTNQNEPGDHSDHVIICGLGNVGYRVVRLLMRLGLRGSIIAREVKPDWRAEVEPDFSVIMGDAREDALLRQAGIERARAILAVTNDDLANVSIALDARRMNPGISITARIFDLDLAGHLEQALDINRALSASALAVPAFVAAALDSAVQGAFEFEGAQWFVDSEVLTGGTPAENTRAAAPASDLRVPIALERGNELRIRPGPDVKFAAGDRVTYLSRGGGGGNGVAPAARGRGNRLAEARALLTGLREWWRETPMALRFTLFSLLGLIVASVVIFHVALGMSFVDALYFVVATVTTVGYGDINLQNASPGMKLYGCVLMTCGVAIVAMVVSLVTDLILQIRLRDVISRGASRSKGHIIVAGLDNIGIRLVQGLVRHGERVVAIERYEDEEFVQTARELVPVVLGNAKMEETLRKAGAAGAKALIAVTDDDIANLSVVLAAKRARPDCRVIARMFDSALAEKLERALSVDAVLSVSGAAAPTFVGSILCPGVLHGIVLGDHLILVFHRAKCPDPAPPQAAVGFLRDNESALWVKPTGAKAYSAAKADQPFHSGDQVVGIWWRRLSSPADSPLIAANSEISRKYR